MQQLQQQEQELVQAFRQMNEKERTMVLELSKHCVQKPETRQRSYMIFGRSKSKT